MKALAGRLRLPVRWVAWGIVVALGCAGYALGLMPRERELRSALTLAQAAYERAAVNERVLTRSAEIESARNRVRIDLAHLTGRPDESSVLEAGLQLIAGEAAQHGVIVHAVVRGSNSVKSNSIEGLPVTIEVIGHFIPISRFVRDLSLREVLVDVRAIRLEALTGSSKQHPLVRATIDVSVDRILDAKQEE